MHTEELLRQLENNFLKFGLTLHFTYEEVKLDSFN